MCCLKHLERISRRYPLPLSPTPPSTETRGPLIPFQGFLLQSDICCLLVVHFYLVPAVIRKDRFLPSPVAWTCLTIRAFAD